MLAKKVLFCWQSSAYFNRKSGLFKTWKWFNKLKSDFFILKYQTEEKEINVAIDKNFNLGIKNITNKIDIWFIDFSEITDIVSYIIVIVTDDESVINKVSNCLLVNTSTYIITNEKLTIQNSFSYSEGKIDNILDYIEMNMLPSEEKI